MFWIILGIIVVAVIMFFRWVGSDDDTQTNVSSNPIYGGAFTCQEGSCDACERRLTNETAYRITGDCFYDSEEYMSFLHKRQARSNDPEKRMDLLLDITYRRMNRDRAEGFNDREKNKTICSRCIHMFDPSGIIGNQ